MTGRASVCVPLYGPLLAANQHLYILLALCDSIWLLYISTYTLACLPSVKSFFLYCQLILHDPFIVLVIYTCMLVQTEYDTFPIALV